MSKTSDLLNFTARCDSDSSLISLTKHISLQDFGQTVCVYISCSVFSVSSTVYDEHTRKQKQFNI